MPKPNPAPSPQPDRTLTKEQFKNMSWEEVWQRAIPIDREEFIRRNRPGR